MTSSDFTMTPEAYNAHLLDGVMDASTPPNEPPAEAAKRQASIVEMFRTFEASDALEAMVACHCIALHFVLRAAMRDAGNTALDPAPLTRRRSQAMSISKTLHMWMTKFDTMKARNEARAADAAKKADAADAAKKADAVPPPDEVSAPATPVPPQMPVPPPSSPGQTRPLAARSGPPAPTHPGLAALAAKEAQVAGAKPNGHAPGPVARANL